MGRERPALGTDKGEGAVGTRSGPKSPARLHHLKVVPVPPYDRAALTQRRVEIERDRNIIGTRIACN